MAQKSQVEAQIFKKKREKMKDLRLLIWRWSFLLHGLQHLSIVFTFCPFLQEEVHNEKDV
jgi:hypothetical protein